MILQALSEYYQRKQADPETALAPRGFEDKPIPFVIVLNTEGQFLQLKDTREIQGKIAVARSYLVPQSKSRQSSKAYDVAFLLWDHYGYLLNQPKIDKPEATPSDKDIQMAANQHNSFKRDVNALAVALPDDAGVQAVKRFLDCQEQVESVKADELYKECLKIKGCNLAFQLVGENNLCCQSMAVRAYISEQVNTEAADQGICLVTGQPDTIARLHGGIRNMVVGKPPPLASIKPKAFESYGKKQGLNFPTGEKAVFEYTTALNYLLRSGSDQKLYLGGTTLACWAQKQHRLENELPMIFDQGSTDNPDSGTAKVVQYYRSIGTGAETNPDDRQPFYILGLAPNPPARIVVRFWLTGTVAEFSQRIGQWFRDIELTEYGKTEFPSLYQLLVSTALLSKADNLPPNLAADIYLAILQGLPLPATVFAGVIRRIRAEKGAVIHSRACLIKAFLNRKYRYGNQTTQEGVTVSLNKDEKRIGYLLGRLFSVLEKLQQDAHGRQLNSTIRDRYYSSASCTPKLVFGTLIRLSTHHLKKLEKPAFRVNADKQIQEIVECVESEQGFPAHLSLEEQGLFAIGYYHQKQAIYQKSGSRPEIGTETGNESNTPSGDA